VAVAFETATTMEPYLAAAF